MCHRNERSSPTRRRQTHRTTTSPIHHSEVRLCLKSCLTTMSHRIDGSSHYPRLRRCRYWTHPRVPACCSRRWNTPTRRPHRNAACRHCMRWQNIVGRSRPDGHEGRPGSEAGHGPIGAIELRALPGTANGDDRVCGSAVNGGIGVPRGLDAPLVLHVHRKGLIGGRIHPVSGRQRDRRLAPRSMADGVPDSVDPFQDSQPG